MKFRIWRRLRVKTYPLPGAMMARFKPHLGRRLCEDLAFHLPLWQGEPWQGRNLRRAGGSGWPELGYLCNRVRGIWPRNIRVYGAGFSPMTRIESAEALHPCSYWLTYVYFLCFRLVGHGCYHPEAYILSLYWRWIKLSIRSFSSLIIWHLRLL